MMAFAKDREQFFDIYCGFRKIVICTGDPNKKEVNSEEDEEEIRAQFNFMRWFSWFSPCLAVKRRLLGNRLQATDK